MLRGQTLALVLVAVAFSTLGQLLLKAGARHLPGNPVGFLFAATRDMRVLAGLAAWVVSTICWLYVLRVAPLSRAYGLSSLTYLLVPLASVYLLGEELRRPHALGMLLILLGVASLLAGE
jgi:multidrug transporter EmrE-like cation transporter